MVLVGRVDVSNHPPAWEPLCSIHPTHCHPQIAQTTRSPNPVRRPSGGAVERGVWHGCQTRNDGPGMAHRDDPRSSAGAREVERSETRMPGALSLWLLSLSREQRESNSA